MPDLRQIQPFKFNADILKMDYTDSISNKSLYELINQADLADKNSSQMDRTNQTSETQLGNAALWLNHNIVEDSSNQIEIEAQASIGSNQLISSMTRETDITRAAQYKMTYRRDPHL